MKLISILIRAYRSFNYDYRKKYRPQSHQEKKPWEMIEDQWFPFIEIPIHSQITTIVGANESGKTHLINAVLHALGKKENFSRLDRCRYLKSANTKLYENMSVGLHWKIEEIERKRFEYLFAGLWPEAPSTIEQFYLFRDPQGFLVYAQTPDNHYLRARLSKENESEILAILPEVIELKSSLKLNKVVLIRDLILYDNFQRMEHFVQTLNKVAGVSWSARFREIWRNNSLQDLFHFTQEVLNFLRKDVAFFSGAKELKDQGRGIVEALITERVIRHFDLPEDAFSEQKLVESLDSFILALQKTFDSHTERERLHGLFFPREGSLLDLEIEYNLIMKTAQCERSLLYDLCESVDEVTVPNALTLLNEKLEKFLQLKSWWVQDEKIKLVVDVKNQEGENYLIFRIKDKSEAVYDMDERSSGLQYFIGYFLQYSCYEKFRKKQCLVFMDEPDRYLSRKGQKALLRIFEELSSSPVGDRPPYQVLYSTHSPFLLDRNKLERLVLLEKGPAGEGSRIHTQELFRYEPIRSAMGQAISDNLSLDYFNILVGEEHSRILIEGLLYHFYQTHPAGSYLDLNETLIHSTPSWSNLFYTLNNLKNQKNKLLLMVLFPARQHALKTFLAQKNQLTLLPYQTLCMTDLHARFLEIEDLIPYSLYRLALIEYAKKWNSFALKLPTKRTFWSDTWTFAEKILLKHNLPVDRPAILKEFLKLLPQEMIEKTAEIKQAEQILHSNFLALNQRFLVAERENRFDLHDRLTLYNVLFHFRLFRENKAYSEQTVLEDLAQSNLFKSHMMELFQEIHWYLQTKSSVSRRIEESLEKLKTRYQLDRRDTMLTHLKEFYQELDQIISLAENVNQLLDQERLEESIHAPGHLERYPFVVTPISHGAKLLRFFGILLFLCLLGFVGWLGWDLERLNQIWQWMMSFSHR